MGVLRAMMALQMQGPPADSYKPGERPGDRNYLEAEVRERLVGLSHPMDLVALLHRSAATFDRLQQFIGQALGHRFLTALACRLLEPTHRQGDAANRTNFHGNLVVRPAHAA